MNRSNFPLGGLALGLAAIIILLILNFAVGERGQPTSEGELLTFTSEEFSFQYPKNWVIQDQSSREYFSYVALANYDPNALVGNPHATGNFFKIEIVKLPNSDNLTLEEWVNDFIKKSEQDFKPTILEKQPATFSNQEAIFHLERIEQTQSIHPVIYVRRGNDIYLFNVSALSEEFEPIFEKFSESFSFL